MSARLSIRIDLEGACRVGPGKARLLELIEETGSISAAGRAMAMSYRRAWLLVESLNIAFRAPVVAAQPGGRRGGGARLTPFGRELVARYRAIERAAASAVGPDLAAIEGALKPTDDGAWAPTSQRLDPRRSREEGARPSLSISRRTGRPAGSRRHGQPGRGRSS